MSTSTTIHKLINDSKIIPPDSLNPLSAEQIVYKIKALAFSCQDLLSYYQQQYQQHNPRINAIVATNFDEARKRAQLADEALANGEDWGPLHGLPMTIKDCYEVVSMPTTAGNPALKDYYPKRNADAVQKLIDAGAIIFGKTNVPFNAGDLQSYNDIYGTTNNPWDISRTPGGSSGGAAAAIVAGLTPIELGSDLGGSIRTPCHYCGVFGHKPSHGIVSLKGHIPDAPGTLSQLDMGVAGPIAKTPGDLALLLDILTAPNPSMKVGWKLELSVSQKKALNEYRVLAWFDDPIAAIDNELREQYQSLLETLKSQGVQVEEGAPDGLALTDVYIPYLKLLGGVIATFMPKKQRIVFTILAPVLALIGRFIGFPKSFLNTLKGLSQSLQAWKKTNETRLQLREDLQSTFDTYDIILMPIVPTVAIVHNQKSDVPLRKMTVNNEQRSYTENFPWISFATVLELPATSAPIGISNEGLPISIQIVSNKFKDKETIQFAKLLYELVGKIECPAYK